MTKNPPKASESGASQGKGFLQITSRRGGFRRAGRAWPAGPITVEAAAFSAGQVQALMDEPMLTVVVVGADKATPPQE